MSASLMPKCECIFIKVKIFSPDNVCVTTRCISLSVVCHIHRGPLYCSLSFLFLHELSFPFLEHVRIKNSRARTGIFR